jgi:hypothetical protein
MFSSGINLQYCICLHSVFIFVNTLQQKQFFKILPDMLFQQFDNFHVFIVVLKGIPFFALLHPHKVARGFQTQ